MMMPMFRIITLSACDSYSIWFFCTEIGINITVSKVFVERLLQVDKKRIGINNICLFGALGIFLSE